MNAKTIRLIGVEGKLVAVAHVVDQGGYYGGTIDLSATPPDVRELFELFDDLVNSQQFICADEIESKIDALSIRAVFEDGVAAPATDLQVYPSTGNVSFKVVAATPANGTWAPVRVSQPR
jgi:hypothetical protein